MEANQTRVTQRRVTGTVLGLMAACVVVATALTLSQLVGLETEGGEWQAHAFLIALYQAGGKAAIAGLFVGTGALLAALCRREFEEA